MANFSKYSALLFLSIFAAYLVSGVTQESSKYHNSGFDSVALKSACQKTTHLGHISSGGKKLSKNQDLPSEDKQPVESTSCSTSLHILIVDNSFLFEPTVNEQRICTCLTILTPQSFVYQEPDPPRLS